MSSQPSVRKISLMGSTALTRPSAALGAMALMLGSTSAYAIDANTLPTGGVVAGGASTISQSGARMDVNQSTDRTVIDWRSFDVGSNAHVNFDQPSTSAIAVNRINASTAPSQINGALTANGNVWVLNPNGVMFGADSRVDVSGLVASTGNINVGQFMSGSNRIDFTGGAGGSVINEGQITVSEGGMAAFVAPHVRNNGVIRARLGKVTLAAGETFTLDLAGDKLVEIGLGSANATAEQFGQVIAEGGIIDISATAAGALIDSVVNVTGYTSVASATFDGGDIVLGGGTITTAASAVFNADAAGNGDGGTIIAYADIEGDYDGSFSAHGGATGGDGGFVETSGKTVKIADGIRVDTSAANGETGNWSIDPDDLVVGTDISAATIVGNLATTDVTLEANNSITVNEAIDSSAQANTSTLALNDENSDNNLTINLNADISLGSSQTLTGQGTTVNVAAGTAIQNGVDVAAAGGATVNVADGTYVGNVLINKSNLSLLSATGRDATTIEGVSGVGALGSVLVASGSNGFTLGSVGRGFTVVGIDNGAPGIENAAVYFQAANAGSSVIGNRITAKGEAGLLSEYNAAVTNMVIDNNIFDGQTFLGANPGDEGFSNQFTAANVPRQLVVMGGGASVTNTQNITFTNNQVTGTAGGTNIGGQEQGNTLVTIDVVGATISGNTFAGTTTRFGNQLRARGTATSISGNTFNNISMGANTTPLFVRDGIFSGLGSGPQNFASLIAANTFQNGGVWTDKANGGYYSVGKGNIQAFIDFADVGGTVNIFDGTYTSTTTLNVNKAVTLAGQSEAGTIIDQSGVAGYGISVSANDVTLSDFTLYGPAVDAGSSYGIKVSPGGVSTSRLTNFAVSNVTVRGSGRAELDFNGVDGATVTNFTADGRSLADANVETKGAGIQIGDSANVTLTGVTTLGNAWGGVALFQANRFYDQQTTNIAIDAALNTFNEVNGLYSEDESATNDFGTLNLAGFSNVVKNPNHRPGGDNFTFFQRTTQAAVDFAMALPNQVSSFIEGWTGTATNGIFTVGTATGGGAMNIGTAVGVAQAGNTINVLDGTYAENVTTNQQLNLGFGTVAIDGLTVNGAGSTLSGDLSSSVNGFTFSVPLLLAGNTSLTTTGAATITAGTIDGTTAGGQTLTLNSAAPLSLSSLGATTRLGATSIASAGGTSLAGNTFNANSLSFAGDVTLTQALTTFNSTQSPTQAGNITFTGNIFGTTANGQSAAFVAGDGLGASSTNGDISLQNVATEALKLDSLTVSGDDFSAATVWLETAFNSLLSGNQFFTTDTLHVGGTATSNVGGNATGPVNAGGSVTVNAGGAIAGNINSGSTVTLNGQTVTGAITAPGGGTITAQTVNANLNGGNFTVNAGSGSVTGNPAGLNTAGSGTLNVNGQTVVGSSEANFNQIVVEGYVLPQGAFVTGSGEIVLPQGLSIGLISPAAGEGEGSEPKVIFVRSVQRLGALLSEGYTAIVIDLNDGFDDSEQEIALAQ